jgi:hypothetical protein
MSSVPNGSASSKASSDIASSVLTCGMGDLLAAIKCVLGSLCPALAIHQPAIRIVKPSRQHPGISGFTECIEHLVGGQELRLQKAKFEQEIIKYYFFTAHFSFLVSQRYPRDALRFCCLLPNRLPTHTNRSILAGYLRQEFVNFVNDEAANTFLSSCNICCGPEKQYFCGKDKN